ncbi:hypothetical protein XELAEV_18034193mg [Xenopus laevis]|uniref:Uncharacterized protein n=1 Tax=Xenopus laevis TaxID=8355 RepID=A0A974CDJ2_XENLA|nr:hypothetical protein XELAEV_18034193mg [Xenopus laevis]
MDQEPEPVQQQQQEDEEPWQLAPTLQETMVSCTSQATSQQHSSFPSIPSAKTPTCPEETSFLTVLANNPPPGVLPYGGTGAFLQGRAGGHMCYRGLSGCRMSDMKEPRGITRRESTWVH